MKNLKKKILFGIALIFSLVFSIILGIRIFMQTRKPSLEGRVFSSYLKDKVTVTRDNWGVPHIKAKNGRDGYFAYGYTLAQDRLFQMELQRRFAKGELAEILGDVALDFDIMHRTLLFRRSAEKYLSDPGKIDSDALILLDSFLAGVNAYMENGPLPFEFTVLGIEPKKFTRIDSIAMIGYMSYSFSKAIKTDSLYTFLKNIKKIKKVDELFGGYSGEDSYTIMESQPGLQKNAVYGSVQGPENKYAHLDFTKRVELEIKRFLFESGRVGLPKFASFDGSNSWVIGPKRSKSGKAILANDLHIVFTNPGIWYEAHIKFDGYENYGYFLPLFPFPLIGHNSDRAWALTMFENDDMDLYYETFHHNDSSLVKYRGKWVKIREYTEAIHVKGGKDHKLKIRITPHGPIVNEIMPIKFKKPVSIYWVPYHVENPVVDAIYGVNTSRNIKEFERSISVLASPGLNFSYVDKEGNIAWWAAAKIPIRPSHVNHKEILDGASGRDEILGYLPFKKNPQMKNPKHGIIITANNQPTKKERTLLRSLRGYWRPTDRFFRIAQALSTKKTWSANELKSIQTDLKFSRAPALVKNILTILMDKNYGGKLNNIDREALSHLSEWDFNTGIKSQGATIFYFLTYFILKNTIEDEIGEKNFKNYYLLSEHWHFLKSLIPDKGSIFWDRQKTQKIENRSDIIYMSWKDAVKKISTLMGSDVKKWQWGKIHTVEYMHPLGFVKPLNYIFNIGPMPSPGEAHVANRMLSHVTENGLKVFSGPSTRRIIDYGDLRNSYSILPTGNSGNFLSPHYDDQAEMFLEGKYRKINFFDEDIKKNTEHILMFIPKK